MRRNNDVSMMGRRRFLQSAGAALALPNLMSLANKASAAEAPERPRFIAIYIPNGVVLDRWFSHYPGVGGDAVERFAHWQGVNGGQPGSSVNGDDWTLGQNLQAFEEAGVKEKIALYNYLSNQTLANGTYDGGEHPVGSTAFLNCHGQRSNGGLARSEVSIDQVIADFYAAGSAPSPHHSIHLSSGIEHYHADAVAQRYSENISWRNDRSPVDAIVSPRLAFETYIGRADIDDAQGYKKRSILDYVNANAQTLKNQLSFDDRAILEEYLTSVRALEVRINASADNVNTCVSNTPNPPHYTLGGVDYSRYDRPAHMAAHYDLMALAAKCRLTDVMTYVVDHERSEYNYGPGAGDHHGAQHGSSDGLSQIVETLVEGVASFLNTLDSTVEANGKTVLDNSVVMFGSGLMGRFYDQRGEDNTHQRKSLPLVFAGSGCGALKTNQEVALPFGSKLANCYSTLLDVVYQHPDTQFANSDGYIEEMKA